MRCYVLGASLLILSLAFVGFSRMTTGQEGSSSGLIPGASAGLDAAPTGGGLGLGPGVGAGLGPDGSGAAGGAGAAGGGPAEGAGGGPGAASEVPPAADKQAASPRPRAALVAEKLAQPIHGEFVNVPLTEMLHRMSEELDVQFHVLLEGREASDQPVFVQLRRTRADLVLELALEPLGLSYGIRDEVVLISPHEEDVVSVRVYPCGDLLAGWASPPVPERLPGPGAMPGLPGLPGASEGMGMPGGMIRPEASMAGMMGSAPGMGGLGMGGGEGMMAPGFSPPTAAADLMDVIQATVQPESWSDQGGLGEIHEFRGSLVVRQTGPQHRRVEELLTQLREAASTQQP